jgi:hypothetical protein
MDGTDFTSTVCVRVFLRARVCSCSRNPALIFVKFDETAADNIQLYGRPVSDGNSLSPQPLSRDAAGAFAENAMFSDESITF